MGNNADELLRRYKKAFNRESLDSLWQEIADLCYPERAEFVSTRHLGDDLFAHVFDGTPVMLRRDLGNNFSAMMRPSGHQWGHAALDEEIPGLDERAKRVWLQHMTKVVWRALYRKRSGFVRATKQGDHDFAAFGNCVISAELIPNAQVIRYICHHLRDCAWRENYLGDIDTMFRRMKMPARQIRQMFRDESDRIPDIVQDALDKRKGDPDTEFEVVHIMMPREEYEFERRKPPKNAPWASLYVCPKSKTIIREAFAYEFRYVVARWQRIPGSIYGVSPAAMAGLPDGRMINTMARIMLEAAEKSIDPPLKATQKAIIGEINIAAAGITWVDRDYDEKMGAALEPIELGKNVQVGIAMLERTKEALTEAWYASKLALPTGGERRTAYEMARRTEEFIRAATPLFEPMEQEYNVPLLDLTAQILLRINAFDLRLMPPELAERDIDWGFSNPLRDAIEKAKIFQYQQDLENLALAQGFDPETVHEYDVRRGFRGVVLANGGPAENLRPMDEVEQRVAEARKEVEAAKALAGAQGVGDAVKAIGEGMRAGGEGAAALGMMDAAA